MIDTPSLDGGGKDEELSIFNYSDFKSYLEWADVITERAIAEASGRKLPEEIHNVFKERYLNKSDPLKALRSDIETKSVKLLLQKWFDLTTSSKAVGRRILRVNLGLEHGNPKRILLECGIPAEEIPEYFELDRDHKTQSMESMSQSDAVQGLAAAVVYSFLLKGIRRGDFGSVRMPEGKVEVTVTPTQTSSLSLEMEALRLENAELKKLLQRSGLLSQLEENPQGPAIKTEEAGGKDRSALASGFTQSKKLSKSSGKTHAEKRRPVLSSKGSSSGSGSEVDESELEEEENPDSVESFGEESSQDSDGRSGGRSKSRSTGKSKLVKSQEEQLLLMSTIRETVTIGLASTKAPEINTFNSLLRSSEGLPMVNCRNDVYTVKMRRTLNSEGNLTEVKLYAPGWKAGNEFALAFGARNVQKYLWPQSFPELKAFLVEQNAMLDIDCKTSESRRKALEQGGYNVEERREYVRGYSQFLKDIMKVDLLDGEDPGHDRHVQVYAVYLHFHYLVWNFAMASNDSSLLDVERVSAIFERYFSTKLTSKSAVVLNSTASMRDSLVFLGYGCYESKCKRIGMLHHFCMYCNKDVVGSMLSSTGGKTLASGDNKTSQGSGYFKRYKKWIADQKAAGVTDSQALTRSKFEASTPAPSSSTSKAAVASTRVVRDGDYYEWLERNQSLVTIRVPPQSHLN